MSLTSSTILPPLYEGRVSRLAFQAPFYAFAMVGAMTRMALQIQVRRHLQLDDYFLLFACLCLTAGTIVGYINVDNLYFSEDLNLNPGEFVELLEAGVDVAGRIDAYERLYYTYPALL
ncbi:hypothetical protein MMC15_003563 [Xylographa vitiligo]|nr:hypothetical protein [Xylographa vitiligo]